MIFLFREVVWFFCVGDVGDFLCGGCVIFCVGRLRDLICAERLRDFFLVCSGCVIFFCAERLHDFFFAKRGCVTFFCKKKRLRDFFGA